MVLLISWAWTQRSRHLDPPHPLTEPGAPYEPTLNPDQISGIRFGGCPAPRGLKEEGRFSLSSSWCCIPHPAKAHRGGEDAVFATPWVVGCADGVGGWAARGIDSGLYARGLMEGCKNALSEVPGLMCRVWEASASGQRGGEVAGAYVRPGSLLRCVRASPWQSPVRYDQPKQRF
jgi:hypothetical protein